MYEKFMPESHYFHQHFYDAKLQHSKAGGKKIMVNSCLTGMNRIK